MTLGPEDRKALSDVRIAKAREFLEDARANLAEGRNLTSINRSYYAALNAVRALLILEGANPESHEGTVTLLSLRFIKSGLLPVEVVKKFKTLLSRRTDVDYGDFETVDEKDATDSLRIAGEIVAATDKVRREM
ncbi:MAG: HEPN domain-containing protein, partial [Nitrospirae bacterium]|nr:HEPN domain-containing protein [Nitrospirota bacterium]